VRPKMTLLETARRPTTEAAMESGSAMLEVSKEWAPSRTSGCRMLVSEGCVCVVNTLNVIEVLGAEGIQIVLST
jgi:hypothetical protein